MTEETDLDLPAVMRDRREKLERLRASGIDPYSRGFRPTQTSQAAKALLGDGERTEPVAVAGRLMVKRLQGGVVFADLQDGEGRIQLMANRDKLGEEEFNRFADLDPGDIIGVTGRSSGRAAARSPSRSSRSSCSRSRCARCPRNGTG